VYFYFYSGEELQAVRHGKWKLHLEHDYETVAEPGSDGTRGREESSKLPLSLFDLDADPGETMDLAAQYPDLVLQLTQAATAFDADIKMNLRPAGQR
jgi:arylsulfatase A-like enzyme